jgi:hypothetical protein
VRSVRWRGHGFIRIRTHVSLIFGIASDMLDKRTSQNAHFFEVCLSPCLRFRKQEEALFAAELDAELGAAHAMSTAASFQAEAEMHLALSAAAAASVPPPADKLNTNAPQQASAAVATAVFDFCKKPVAQSPQALRGFVALAGKVDLKDAVVMCIEKLVDAFDQGPIALAKLAPGACLNGLTYAYKGIRIM